MEDLSDTPSSRFFEDTNELFSDPSVNSRLFLNGVQLRSKLLRAFLAQDSELYTDSTYQKFLLSMNSRFTTSSTEENRSSEDFADIVLRGNDIEIFYRSGIQHVPDQEYQVNVQLIAVSGF